MSILPDVKGAENRLENHCEEIPNELERSLPVIIVVPWADEEKGPNVRITANNVSNRYGREGREILKHRV